MTDSDGESRSITADLITRRFLLLLLVLFLGAAMTAPVGSLLPAYVEEELGFDPVFTGTLQAVPILLGGLLCFISGALADWLGYKQTFLLGVVGATVTGLLFLSSQPVALFAISAAIGVSMALHIVGSQSYLLGAVAPASLGLGGAVFFIAYTLGNSAGNLVLGPVAQHYGWDAAAWCMIVGSAAVSCLAVVLLPRVPLPVDRARRTFLAGLKGYGQLVRRDRVVWLLAIRFLPTCLWGAASLAFPLLLFRETETKTNPTGYAATSLAVAACFQILTGRVCDRYGRHWPTRIAAMAVCAFAVLTGAFAHSVLGLWICGIALTASAWSLSTTIPGLMNELVDPSEKGRVVGAAHLAWSLGMALGMVGGGWLLGHGPSECYYVGAIFAGGAVAAAWSLYPPGVTRRPTE